MSKDFKVTVHEPKRREEWLKIFGTDTLHVTTGFPVEAMIQDKAQMCYMVDMQMLTPKQYADLGHHLQDKFGMQYLEVLAAMNKYGVPILATDCTLVAEGYGASLSLSLFVDTEHDFSDDFDYDYDLDDRDWQD